MCNLQPVNDTCQIYIQYFLLYTTAETPCNNSSSDMFIPSRIIRQRQSANINPRHYVCKSHVIFAICSKIDPVKFVAVKRFVVVKYFFGLLSLRLHKLAALQIVFSGVLTISSCISISDDMK